MNKLYLFNYDSYGEYYTVVAKSSQKALQAVKDFLLTQVKHKTASRSDKTRYLTYDYERYLTWKNATLDSLPFGYSLQELSTDTVLIHEYS